MAPPGRGPRSGGLLALRFRPQRLLLVGDGRVLPRPFHLSFPRQPRATWPVIAAATLHRGSGSSSSASCGRWRCSRTCRRRSSRASRPRTRSARSFRPAASRRRPRRRRGRARPTTLWLCAGSSSSRSPPAAVAPGARLRQIPGPKPAGVGGTHRARGGLGEARVARRLPLLCGGRTRRARRRRRASFPAPAARPDVQPRLGLGLDGRRRGRRREAHASTGTASPAAPRLRRRPSRRSSARGCGTAAWSPAAAGVVPARSRAPAGRPT